MHDTSRLHPHHRDAPTTLEGRRATIALGVLCLCALTTALDITITNVALPFISTELDATTSALQWIIDAYNVVLAGLLVLGGGLADRFGRRRVFLIGWATFGLACLVAAYSPTVGILIAARVLMGVGAAGVIAPALAIVAGIFPPERRGVAIAVWAAFGALGLALGPIMGGVLLDRFWWGSVFLVNVPIVALGVALGAGVIPDSRKPDAGPLDVTAGALSVVGLGGLAFAVIELPHRGLGSPVVVGALAVGVFSSTAFVRRELHDRVPLFDVGILARRVVVAGAATLFVAYVTFTGMLFLVPQYLQNVAGESILAVGMLLVPFAVTFGLASMRATPILERFGPSATIAAGLAGCATGAGLLAATLDRPVAWTVLATMVLGLGLSLLIAPASTIVMNDLPPAAAGHGSSLNMVSRFVGGAIGVAVVGSLYASGYARHIDGALGSLSGADATSAEGSIAGAESVAARLGGSEGAALASAARDAFDAGARLGYLVMAVLAALTAAWAWWALRQAQGRQGSS